jgi:hypothetical protein
VTATDVEEHMNRLTQAGRDRAADLARTSIRKRNGPKPTPEQFQKHITSDFSDYQAMLVYVLLLVPLTAWFAISAMSLFQIGSQEFVDSSQRIFFGVVKKGTIVGVAVILGAEISQIIFVIAHQVVAKGRKTAERVFIVGMVLSTLVALVGNAQHSLTGTDLTPFRFLIALTPPVIVLLLGEILALLWLEGQQLRHESNVKYSTSLKAWQAVDQEPSKHSDWIKVFATALREELCHVNEITVDDLSPEEWRDAVMAELGAEDWLDLQRNSLGIQVDKGATAIAQVVEFLHQHPDIALALQNKTIMQSDIASKIGVSQASVSRGLARYSTNGHDTHERIQ